MAQNTFKTNTSNRVKGQKGSFKIKSGFFGDRRLHLAVGLFLIVGGLFLFTALISYLFTGKVDQSVVASASDVGYFKSGMEAENWLGLAGAFASHYFVFQWFGIASFMVPPLLFLLGYKVVFRKEIIPIKKASSFTIFFLFWLSLLFGYFLLNSEAINNWGFLGGGIGYEMAVAFNSIVGWGTFLFLIFSLLVFVIFFFNITTMLGFTNSVKEGIHELENKIEEGVEELKPPTLVRDPEEEDLFPEDEEANETADWEVQSGDSTENPEGVAELEVTEVKPNEPVAELELEVEMPPEPTIPDKSVVPEFVIEREEEEKKSITNTHYDPKLDLPKYQYPKLDLLNVYDSGKVQVTKEELEQNKDRIIETLINFKIGISSIKATIGPTVTLYEIVPEAGVKISKIKNLEDDIALSLAALGIRIIAPIPGKGTIGIEVPNKNREMVDIRTVMSTEKFMNTEFDLPVVLGKTISNEVYMVDLAKMPHLLMAGATGQGKSVGINTLIASLVYKKHPSQLKFVLIDPKKVELSLFNKIERHFLAKLPDSEEAIITDTKKVVYTLNSLCIEMDQRYDMMKNAGARNIKEYNTKFVNRRLNPEKGHRYLPYIVLIIDELADLMMTAGKEVEMPVARIAQLARAIGIHLVVATQRPSVNVITGVIKANFPARLSFRVTSKIDSRTILDSGGAEQLVGMGDMLLSHGSDIIRLQCAFVDTPEVERICDFIGEQRGYDSAYVLPEYVGEESEGTKDVDLSDRDVLFDDAARLIVAHQQGSTSLIQRKLKLGYNRAGRLIDQLEAAGIVGPFEGSKAREVLISDEYSLEQLLNEING